MYKNGHNRYSRFKFRLKATNNIWVLFSLEKKISSIILSCCHFSYLACISILMHRCILIKTRSPCISLVPQIHNSCPFVEHMWMYREPTRTITSIIGISNAFLAAKEMHWLIKLFMSFMPAPPPFAPFPPSPSFLFKSLLPDDDPEAANAVKKLLEDQERSKKMDALFWGRFLALHLINYSKCGVKMLTVSYEDLLEKPEETLKPLLKLCGISETALPDCLTAMKKDSQVRHWQWNFLNYWSKLNDACFDL